MTSTVSTTNGDAASTTNNNNNIKTYRHEFGKEFMANLSCFSKVHQYDDRHAYKSEWTKWTQQEEIAQAIDVEKRRLQENGYKGDIEDKMFKAGRYYFRKKTLPKTAATADAATITPTAASFDAPTPRTDDNDDEEEEDATESASVSTTTPHQQQRQRRPYITMSKDAIRLMDDHIANMHNASTATAVFKPSICYENFYQTKMSSNEMTKEIEKIIEKYETASAAASAAASASAAAISPDELTNEIIDKIKKTYKNRYYKFASLQQPK
jgi:ribosomal protein L17